MENSLSLSPLSAIQQAFESRGIPKNLYELDATVNELRINVTFLETIRQYSTWTNLEEYFTKAGGQVIPVYSL